MNFSYFTFLPIAFLFLCMSTFGAHAKTKEIIAIGKYGNGCIQNDGIQLPPGEGYQIVRRSRDRIYAHPNAIDFIKEYSAAFHKKQKRVLLVADISQKGGGLMPWGHRSHQTGLDIDFLFEMPPEKLSENDAEHIRPRSMLTDDHESLSDKRWSLAQETALKMATEMERVDRIFVHPKIKQHLCEKYKGEKWLRKIRPWFGHHNHFHVRIKCPKDDKDCVPTVTIPRGTSCRDSDFAYWFSKSANLKAISQSEPSPKHKKPPVPKHKLHPKCR